VSVGSKNLLNRELNELYKRRAILKHVYTVENKPAINAICGFNNNESIRSVSVLPSHGEVVLSSSLGKVYSLDFSFSMVDMINLFEECSTDYLLGEGSLTKGEDINAGLKEIMCRVSSLLERVR
jgi:hypothetical protein